MPIYKGFYGGFMPKHEWKEDRTGIISHTGEEHGELWIQLFLDLVYVAMFINLSSYIENCGHELEVLEAAFGIFLMLFTCRLSIDEYSNRFYSDDIFHRLAYFMYTFGILIMVMCINDAPIGGGSHRGLRAYSDSSSSSSRGLATDVNSVGSCEYVKEYWDGFLIGFIITRVSLMTLYGMVCIQSEQARKQFLPTVFSFALSTLLAAIATGRYPGMEMSLEVYFEISIIEVIFHILPKTLQALHAYGFTKLPQIEDIFPMDIYECQNRLGVLFMMVLGESIIQLTTFNFEPSKAHASIRFVAFAFIYVFSLGMQYFDAIHRSHGQQHAMKRTRLTNISFVWLHPILVFAILLATVGIVMQYHALQAGDAVDLYYNRMLGAGAFVVVVLFAFMRAMHKGLRKCLRKFSTAFHFFVRILFAFVHLGLSWFEGGTGDAIMYHALISLAINVVDICVALRHKDKYIWSSVLRMSQAPIEMIRARAGKDSSMTTRDSSMSSNPSTSDANPTTGGKVFLEENPIHHGRNALRESSESG